MDLPRFMIDGCAAVAVVSNVFVAEEDYSYFNLFASFEGGHAFLDKRNDIKYKGGFAGAVGVGSNPNYSRDGAPQHSDGASNKSNFASETAEPLNSADEDVPF